MEQQPTTTHTAETVKAAIEASSFAARKGFAPLTYAEQRRIFGAEVLGRLQVEWNARRSEVEYRFATISRDTIYGYLSCEKVAQALNRGERIYIQK